MLIADLIFFNIYSLKKQKNKIRRFVFLLIFLNSFISNAQNAVSKSSYKAPSQPSKKLSLPLIVEFSGNQLDTTEPDSSRSIVISSLPAYLISGTWAVASKIAVEKETLHQQDTSINNIPISLSYNRYKLFEVISVKNKFSGTIPTALKSREEESYRGALSLATDFSYEFGGSTLPTKLIYGLGLTRNLHEFTQSKDGVNNVQYSLRQDLILGLSLTEELSLEISTIYRHGRSYGDYQRDSFTNAAELALATSKSLGLQMGITTEGNMLTANGRDSNFNYYNENTSIIYAGLTYTL